MSHGTCPTVAIKGEASESNPTGIVIINEEDFDEATMTKVETPKTPAETPLAAVLPPVEPVAKVVAPWAA